MKIGLPKTTNLWKKIYNVIDSRQLYNKRDELQRAIKQANDSLKECESLDEYNSILQEIQSLKEQLTAVEIELRIQPKKEKKIRENELEKTPEVYNQEFQPYYDKYLKLDKELKKQLRKCAMDLEPIVNEMREIEKLEMQFHNLRTKGSNYNRFLRLPINTQQISTDSFYRSYGLACSVELFINSIKKIK